MSSRKRKDRLREGGTPVGDGIELPDAELFSALEDLCTMQQQCLDDEMNEENHFPSVYEFERELLALPADIGFSVAYHRLYPKLVQAHFDVRRLRESKTSNHILEMKRDNVSDQLWKLTSSEEGHKMQQHISNDHFLNEFMYKYCMVVDSLQKELENLFFELEASCQNMLRDVSQLCEESRMIAGLAAPQKKKSTWTMKKNEDVKSSLKAKFARTIKVLKKEFQARQKKGKLPSNATDVLKYWWEKNFHWPYPSEEDKKKFRSETNLTHTQINNWFINQRKRHWHKLFPNGIPSTPEEAMQVLRERGIVSYSPHALQPVYCE